MIEIFPGFLSLQKNKLFEYYFSLLIQLNRVWDNTD